MTVAKSKSAKLKLYTEEPPKPFPPPMEAVGSLPDVLRAFAEATGWSLTYVNGAASESLAAIIRWIVPLGKSTQVRTWIVPLRTARKQEKRPELVRPGQPGRRNHSRTTQAGTTRCGRVRGGRVAGGPKRAGSAPHGRPGRP